jgi:parallel beta-helix repeat protein
MQTLPIRHFFYFSVFYFSILSNGAALGQAVINEPVTQEDFANHDITLDETSVFSGESFTGSGTETVYYVSSSEGSSDNDGLSPEAPWDLATFNTHRANDSIYLFKRGDVFRGSIDRKMQKTQTRFGAYGTGTRPLFLGSIVINSWQQTTDTRVPAAVRSQVYEADLTNAVLGGTDGSNGVRYLFLDRKLMTIARYPDVDAPDQVNWMNIDEKQGTYSFYDQELQAYNNTPDYWAGATLRARTYSWQYSVRQITDYADGVITTESVATPHYPTKGWGYFIDNKLGELDHPGEWYYDSTARKVFFYPPEGSDLNSGLVEGVTYDTGLSIHWLQHDAQVKDLAFKHYLTYCINVNNSDNVVIENVNMQYCRQGIYMYNSNTAVIRNNHIDQSFENGINIGEHSGISITGNTISNNGMFPTYGSFNTALTQGNGINSLSDGALSVTGNTILNSTHSGIVMGTDEALVQNNFIQGAMLHINDGGAITLRGNNIQLLDNIIISVYGDINDGANGYTGNDSTSKHSSYGMGIFDYKAMQGNIISGNTVAYARDIGIMLHEAIDYQVRDNVSYANEVQIQAKKGGSNITVDGNTLFVADNIVLGAGKNANHKGLEITGTHTGLAVDNNLYGTLCSESYIFYDGGYDLDSFAHFNGAYDLNSTSSAAQLPKFDVASVVSTLVDEDFEDCENPNQWSNTSVFSGGKCSDDTSKTGSKSFVKEDATVAPTYFRLKEDILFEQGKVYNMEFDSYASGKTIYELSIATYIDDVWTRLIPEYRFQFKAKKQHHQIMFKALVDMTHRPIFHVKDGDDQQLWIDNFVLQEVEVQPKQKTAVVFDNSALQDIQSDSALLVNKTFSVQSFNLPRNYTALNGQQGQIQLDPFRSAVIVRTDRMRSQAVIMPWLILLL